MGDPERPAIPWTILYIAGYGRSGSTLADVLLGAHPEVLGAGEVTHLYDDVVNGEPCSCGLLLEACPVWSGVLGRVRRRLDVRDWAGAMDVTRRVESFRGGLGRSQATPAAYKDLWRTTFEAIRATTGASVVVDSSKSMEWVVRRLPALQDAMASAPHVAFSAVHLVRDPRATSWSVRLGGNKISAERRFKRLSPLRTAATWSFANLGAERTTTAVPSLRVRYEDLVTDPHAELARVGALVGLSYEMVASRAVAGDLLDVGHGVSGNRMRETGTVQLSADERWTRDATKPARVAAMSAWPVARRYGYSVGRTAR